MQSVFPKKHYAWWSPAFLGMVKHLCSWEIVNEFWILLCLLSWFYLNPWIFSLLPFQFFPPSHQVWVNKQLLTKVNSQHKQNGTLQTIKMQTSACWRQWMEMWQLVKQCAGQGRAERNKEGVGRKPITTVNQHAHHCKPILSSHCHCFSFSLLLTIYMNKRFTAPLTSVSLRKKKTKHQKPQQFWPWQVTF